MDTNRRTRRSGRGTATTALVVVVALVLATAAGTAGVAADSGPAGELEESTGGTQAIDAGETQTYDVQLDEGDYFYVEATFDSAAEIEVTVSGPDGESVGDPYEDPGYSAVDLPNAPAGGTYTVAVENHGDATSFTLATGHEETEINVDETLTYTAELSEGDRFAVDAVFGAADEIEVTVSGPDGEPVGDVHHDGGYATVELWNAPADGTYAVAVANRGEAATAVDLYAFHQRDGDDTEPGGIPDPLEPGYYDGVAIDDAETAAYEIELSEGDSLFVVAESDPDDEIEVALRDPDGEHVGDTYSDDTVAHVDLRGVPTDGTYTVEVENRGETTTFDLHVDHERGDTADPPDPVPDPLEEGYYEYQRIDAGETLTYDADVASGDLFVTVVESEHGDVEVTIRDPDGTPVGTEMSEGNAHAGSVVGADVDGTYTVEIENGGEATTFGLDVLLSETTAIEGGVHAGSLEVGESDYYLIDLEAGDDLSVEFHSVGSDGLYLNVIDPDLELLEDTRTSDSPSIELSGVEQEGTYIVDVYSNADGLTDYELDVGTTDEDGDGEDGEDGDDESDDAGDTDEDDDGEDGDSEDADDEGAEGAGDEGDKSDDSGEGDDDEGVGEEDPDDDDGMPGLGPVSALLALVAATMGTLVRCRTGRIR